MSTSIIPFHELLATLINDLGCSGEEICEIFENKGVAMNPRRLSEYRNAVCTPPYFRAREIFRALDYKINEYELLKSLEENKVYVKENNYSKTQYIQTSLRIRLKNIFPDKVPEQIQYLLNTRIASLYGSEAKFSAYVQDLIKKDLNQFILENEGVEHEKM